MSHLNRLTRSHIGLLFALPQEAAPLISGLAASGAKLLPQPASPHAFSYQLERGDLTLIISGMGSERSRRAALQLLRRPQQPISALIVCGFAGGLAAAAQPGTLVVAERCDAFAARSSGPGSSLSASEELLRCAASIARPSLLRGSLATSNLPVCSRSGKESLYRLSGALAVDMETAAAAEVSEECGVPWLGVRAITDGPSDALPRQLLGLVDAEGVPQLGRLALLVAFAPWRIPALIRLGVRSGRSARALSSFLFELLPHIYDLPAS